MLRLTLCRAGRRAPLGLHARSLSFFSDLRKKVGEELAKNPELQKSLNELREHDAVKAAKDAMQQAKTKAADLASEAKSKAAEIQQSLAEKEELKRAKEWAGKAAEKASEAARSASASASSGSSAAGARAEGGAEGEQQQQREQRQGAGGGPFAWLRGLLADKPDAPAAADVPRAPGADNTDETAVVVKPPSLWEQAFNKAQDSPLLGGLVGAFRGVFSNVGTVGSSVSDRVFGENENAEALAVLRERDAAFRPGPFVSHLEAELIPRLLKAYLAGHLPELKAIAVDQAYDSLQANVKVRMARNAFMDRRILDLSPVELVGFRLVQEEPTAIVQFQTQQVNVVRDTAGNILEGREDDIRAVYYMAALQQRLPPLEEGADITAEQVDTRPSLQRWAVTEMAIRGSLETW